MFEVQNQVAVLAESHDHTQQERGKNHECLAYHEEQRTAGVIQIEDANHVGFRLSIVGDFVITGRKYRTEEDLRID